MEYIGIRKIKNSLSQYLELVKKGEIISITDRGKPVAKLVPVVSEFPPEIIEMLDQKLATWDGGKPKGAIKLYSLRNHISVSEKVSEDRR